MIKTFNRRVLLRGLGGAAVAAPYLQSVAEREAKSQGLPIAAAAPPKRLIVYFTYYGCLTDKWFPKLSHGPLSSDDYAKLDTLKPLAPFAKKLLMPRGLRAMNEWSFQGTLGQKNDPHTQVCGSMFTCYPVTPNAPNSGIDNIGKFDAKPLGRSLDHIAAEQVNPNGGAPLFVQIGGVQGNKTNNMSVISWSAPEEIFPGVGSPMQIYSNLTKLFGTGPVNEDTYKNARGKSLVDLIKADLGRLSSLNMSAADKRRLKDWTDLVHYTSQTVAGAMCSKDAATKLTIDDASVKAGNGTGINVDIDKAAKINMDLAVLTALCDNNRVIWLKMPPSFTYKNLGLDMESHSVSHRIGNAGMGGKCVNGALDMILKIDKYYAELFAYLVGKLDSFAEGERTLLDNTATVWIQEMSDGNSHNLNNMPILQAGDCGGYFKTGQAINLDGGKADMSAGNSSGDCANGQSPTNSLDSVGTPAAVASKPLNKYFCNLLNAIGAKGGADGWPAKGGTAPVSKFGKYDDTKMFSDGGTKPATINDPGEYAELKA